MIKIFSLIKKALQIASIQRKMQLDIKLMTSKKDTPLYTIKVPKKYFEIMYVCMLYGVDTEEKILKLIENDRTGTIKKEKGN